VSLRRRRRPLPQIQRSSGWGVDLVQMMIYVPLALNHHHTIAVQSRALRARVSPRRRRPLPQTQRSIAGGVWMWSDEMICAPSTHPPPPPQAQARPAARGGSHRHGHTLPRYKREGFETTRRRGGDDEKLWLDVCSS